MNDVTEREDWNVRYPPVNTRWPKWTYGCLAIVSASMAAVDLAASQPLHAIPWTIMSGFMACGYSLACGYSGGYRDGFGRATTEAATRKLAAETPRDIAADLPIAFPGEGFLYVLKFSTGGVKVGQTVDLRRRLTEHRRDADAYGVAITDYWVSPSHTNYLDNEIELISFCDGVCTTRGKREYFHGVEFKDVARYANTLAYFTDDLAATGVDR